MAKTAQYQPFVMDKQSFFSSSVDSINKVRTRVSQKEYEFLSKNQLLIEQEFNQLFASLKKNPKHREAFWLYCYYCSLMLQSYYQGYGKFDQAEKYHKLSEEIAYFYEQGVFPDAPTVQSWQNQFSKDLGELASTLKHASKIRSWVSFTNITRLQIVFSRLTLKQSLAIIQGSSFLEKLDEILGRHTDIDGMLSTLDKPAAVLNVLSVGVFAARFVINIGLILKHTFVPSEAEKSLSLKERFAKELGKRHCDLLNDMVWATVNGLTNYAKYFNISAPVANWVTAGFLLFDVSLLVYRRWLAEQEYLLKKEQYLQEKAQHADDDKRCQLLDEQLAELEIHWQASNASYWFNISAAILLMTGFSAYLLLASPVAAPACFFACVLAVAMYLSADMYGKYHEKSMLLQRAEQTGGDVSLAAREMQEARSAFMVSMVKNTMMPLLIMATFAVSWPAAIVLTVLFIGYECGKGYFNQANKPALPAPIAEKNASVDEEELDRGLCYC
ncbi:hypothetical protein [Legionella oakridgensis]|uniref:Coiled-coil protein n=2 Tax=Legionella oakridgensis TaxID=29423 RepID=W0BD68_9GAMM|nr:hypothetical protein [Legionella oakridgensis]AHE68473.1 hypothetical protein Loa_02945 [Legionella oakridgensis ATCC 33761 = DSM 21215]KTD38377.1 coiled-coil protein [Legionella oakridgensis]STY21406.1 coiled-coil protein [Legionella longbeachae]